MTRFSVFSLTITLILSICFLSLSSQANNKADNQGRLPSPTFNRLSADALEQARQHSLNVLPTSQFQIERPQAELQLSEAFTDELAMTHVRMEQHYQGIKVFQGEVITHFNQDGSLAGVTGEYRPKVKVTTTPRVSEAEALTIAQQDFHQDWSETPSAELMILPRNGKYHLTYRVELVNIESENPAARVYFISASTGKILFQYDNLESASARGSGKSLYLGTVDFNTNALDGSFELRDNARGGSFVINMKKKQSGGVVFTDKDNSWGVGKGGNAQIAGIDVHYGVQMTHDYFKNVHNRNGIGNDGKGLYSRVHYGKRYNNAFWSSGCGCVTFGDGDNFIFSPLVSIDVVAHEVAHGLTSRTARLVYSGESGGLNEATSDIFGSAVEFYANNANDDGDWLIGEKIYLGNRGFLRNMANPLADGSIDHYSLYRPGTDVHRSSGIANNFFYLLSEGGTNKTSNLTVSGIGRGKAEKIWYRALTVYMSSGTNYAQARSTTLKAAGDLFGENSPEQNAVAATWTAVGVN